MKQKIIIFSLLILILCTGCSKKENKSELNVLNWSSYIPNSVIVDFERETNIKVNYGTYSSNEECLAKVSSAKKGTYDLIFPSDYMIEIMITRNLIEKLDKTMLTNISNLNPVYLNQVYDPNNEYSLPFLAASTLIAVNQEEIKEQITSYNDLLKPEFKNQIVLLDDQRIIIGMALLALGYDMNSTNQDELNEAREWLEKLKPNIKAYDSDSPKNFLISKEASIAVLWNAEGALASLENPNVINIFPKEGFALSVDNFAIPTGAKNKKEAYQFIDYILRPDVMKRIIESYPYKNVNIGTDSILDKSYLNNPASNIPDAIISNGYYVKNIGKNIKIYDKLWAQIK